jgi:O-Antigen ligase
MQTCGGRRKIAPPSSRYWGSMISEATAIRTPYGPAGPRLRAAGTARSAALDGVILWLLSAFVFVLATDLRLSGNKSIAMRLGYVCLLLGIAGLIKRRAFVLPRIGFWWLCGFVVWSCCSLAWARFPEAAQHKASLYIAVFAVTAIIPQYAWNIRVRARLMDAYLAGCALGILGTILNFALGRPYTPPGDVEMEGRYSFSADPNYLALALVIGMPLALHRAGMVTARWQRALALLYLPASLTGVFLTGSRGAMLAVLVAIIVYALFTRRRAAVLILSGAGLCVALGALLPGAMSERFAGIPDELRYGTLSDRRELWDRGTLVVAQHPLEGIGAGATAGELDIAAHNTPLELMMEGGVVSVGLFYGALAFGIWGVWTSDRKEARTLLAAWSACLVGSLSLSWEINTVTWFMFALLFSAAPARAAVAISIPSGKQAGQL